MQEQCALRPDELWNASSDLNERISKLRKEYFDIEERDFHNEMIPYSNGTEWDIMWSPSQWGVVPELIPFNLAFLETLPMVAEKVELPDGFWEKPIEMRAALFFREVVSKHLPVRILDGELIVGAQFNTAMSRSMTKAEVKRWMKKTKKWMKEIDVLNSNGAGNAGATPGHIIPDYKTALEEGLSGRVKYFESLKEGTRSPEHRKFIDALIETLKAGKDLASRYADEARAEAETTSGQKRDELLEIARICDKVPWEPPETFHEALQALWFIHMLVMIQESYPGPGLSPGRIDQYLYPYYAKDIESGKLDRVQAKELLECFWIKPNYAYDFIWRVGRTNGITSGYGQLITIGGLGPDGEDVSNDLTWLILEVIEEMNLLEPKPNVRLHKGTPPDLLKRVSQMIADALPRKLRRGVDQGAEVAGPSRGGPVGLRPGRMSGEHPAGQRPIGDG